MIVDNKNNVQRYFALGRNMECALRYLQVNDFNSMTPGKQEIEGDEVFVLVQTYETKSPGDCMWEAHREYADIHMVVDGEEQLGYADIKGLKVVKEYDANEDFELLSGNGSVFLCKNGTFAVFFPQDAHMPCLMASESQTVKKVVVKVKMHK